MIILRLLLLLTNLHLKLLSTQGTGADKLLSTQRVNISCFLEICLIFYVVCYMATLISYYIIAPCIKVVLLEVSNLSFCYKF